MTFEVRLARHATEELSEVYDYLSEYDLQTADRHLARLADAIATIGRSPLRYSYFFLTGAPYRARLFTIGRTSFWIVYRVDEPLSRITVLRIWDSRQNPDEFDVA